MTDTIPAAVSALHNNIALLVAGQRVDVTLEALTRALANTIGFACTDRANASEMCALVNSDMAMFVDANWSDLRAARSGLDIGEHHG